jgi:hypothetical protein
VLVYDAAAFIVLGATVFWPRLHVRSEGTTTIP